MPRKVWHLHFSLRKPKVFALQILRRYLTNDDRVQKLFYCLIRKKEPCVRKFKVLARSEILGISQTDLTMMIISSDHNRSFAWNTSDMLHVSWNQNLHIQKSKLAVLFKWLCNNRYDDKQRCSWEHFHLQKMPQGQFLERQ